MRPCPAFPRRPMLGLLVLALFVPTPATSQEPIAEVAGLPIVEYAERRRALLEALDDSVVVIPSAPVPAEDHFRFRQDNNFMYLTGIERPGSALMLVPAMLSPDGQPREVVFLPPRNTFIEQWTGPAVGPGEETERAFGIDEAVSIDQLERRLAEALGIDERDDEADDNGDEAIPPISTIVGGALRDEWAPEGRFLAKLRDAAPGARIADAAPALADLRLVKSEAELALLQVAVDITIEAHRDAAGAIEPGAFEYEVQGALEYAFTRRGAEREAFGSIVGSGPNSVILHYNANRRQMEEGDLVLIDIGAEYRYYAADLTRTYPVSGLFNDRQRAIYQLVLDAQHAAEAAFEPGVSTIGDLHAAAVSAMRASPLRDREGRTLERSFVHGLGHWLGMDVHDVGDYGRPIPIGAVFTIEPGIYIPDEQLGVRIEDDYLATDDGLVKLSAALPSRPDEVEALMAGTLEPAGGPEPVPAEGAAAPE